MAPKINIGGAGFQSKYLLLLIFQVLLVVLYGFFVRYDGWVGTDGAGAAKPTAGSGGTDANAKQESSLKLLSKTDQDEKVPASLYAMFQDVHVMIFIGFGFLMTFLKKYGYSALGFTLLIGAVVIQWAILCQSFFHMPDGKIKITLLSLVEADIVAAAVLISFGAVLGRTTGPQLLVMAIIETTVCCCNLYLINGVLKVADCGGSIAIHLFGAYFGLAASLVMETKKSNAVGAVGDAVGDEDNGLEGPSYSSDITAMLGSIFLWIFWPSFNAALLSDDDEQYRAVVNTYLSLAACTVTAFVVSSMVTHEHKFDMVHIQNSTLAGGVAVGTICNMYIHPFGGLVVGMGAAVISVLGYKYLTPKLRARLRLKDTCGVHNLHGLPALFSGVLSAVFASMAGLGVYGEGLYSVFEGMTPIAMSGEGRDATTQALYQLLGVVATFFVAIVSGAITGYIISLPVLRKLSPADYYDDKRHWGSEEGEIAATSDTSVPMESRAK